jgi:prepilin peptidase CpaA
MEEFKLLALAVILPVTFYTELTAGKIYNWMTLPAIALGLLLSGVEGLEPLVSAITAALIGGGIFFLPYLISGLSRGRPVVGGGDVKLAAAIGALTNTYFVLWTIWWGVLAGGLMGLGVIAWRMVKPPPKEEDGASRVPVLLVRVPFGTALCVGVCIAFTQVYLIV